MDGSDTGMRPKLKVELVVLDREQVGRRDVVSPEVLGLGDTLVMEVWCPEML